METGLLTADPPSGKMQEKNPELACWEKRNIINTERQGYGARWRHRSLVLHIMHCKAFLMPERGWV